MQLFLLLLYKNIYLFNEPVKLNITLLPQKIDNLKPLLILPVTITIYIKIRLP